MEFQPVEKKILKAEKLSAIWMTVAKLAHQQEYQKAYDIALTELDDE